MWKEIKILSLKELSEIREQAKSAMRELVGVTPRGLVFKTDNEFHKAYAKDIPRLIEALEKAVEVIRFYSNRLHFECVMKTDKSSQYGRMDIYEYDRITNDDYQEQKFGMKAREFLKEFEGE